MFPGLRRASAFSISASVHGLLLAWVAFSTPLEPESRKSLYELEIRPHEDHLVWYNLHDSLPDISPSTASHDRRPSRARVKFNQTLVAGAKDRPHDRQMIFTPEPPVEAPKPQPLPNVLAVATPAPARPFVPPETPRPKLTAPAPLPEAPKPPVLAMDVPEFKPVLPAAPHRAFNPPPKPKTAAKSGAPLPEAPLVSAVPLNVPEYKPALPLPPRRAFTPPKAKPVVVAAAPLPEAPVASTVPVGVPEYKSSLPASPHRAFTPPPATKHASAAAPDLPDAPSVSAPAPVAGAYHPAIPPAPHKEFVPPARKAVAAAAAAMPDAPDAPSAAPGGPPASATLAIAGLDPAKLTELPKPPGSRDAGFSAGPEERPKGGRGGGPDENSHVVVPGLLARGGSAAIPLALPKPKILDPAHSLDALMPPAEGRATRVANSPDPLLTGRVIYTMAIQMPNVTSFSGSWMVWFAERNTESGHTDVVPPVPLRKVDPKYVATAVTERIEGKVRLSAVIRKDGHVDSVVLLRHLDPRLDQTAEEALSKWIFEPARRGGNPIDVDAVFEIPFFLAPAPKNAR